MKRSKVVLFRSNDCHFASVFCACTGTSSRSHRSCARPWSCIPHRAPGRSGRRAGWPRATVAAVPSTRSFGSAMSRTVPIKRFRDVPRTMGNPSVRNSSSRSMISRLCSRVFPKPMPGSIRILFPADARLQGDGGAFIEVVNDLADDVVVHRIHLHVPRRPLDVHEHHGGTMVGNDPGHIGREAEAADVVHDGRARFKRLPCNARLVGIDRDRHRKLGGNAFDDRDDPLRFLLLGKRFGAGPRGLSADVDDVRALG